MPISFKIVADAGYFLAVWQGQITEDEVFESYTSFLNANDSLGHFKELCDLSDVDLSEIKLEGLKRLSAIIRDFCERNQIQDARCACFVPAEINHSVMALYDQVSKESAEVTTTFTELGEALAWLQS